MAELNKTNSRRAPIFKLSCDFGMIMSPMVGFS